MIGLKTIQLFPKMQRSYYSTSAAKHFLMVGKGGWFSHAVYYLLIGKKLKHQKVDNWVGVNHCIILAVSPKLPENHYNFAKIFALCQFFRLHKFFSLDDKAKCPVCGHQGCSSTYPCVYCYTPKEDFHTLEQTGAVRTVASLAIDYEGFQDSGMTRTEGGKHSFNIVLPPQIFGTIAEHLECKDPVYFHCMPSGLHYILGIVELFHDNMKIKFPEETAEWVYCKGKRQSQTEIQGTWLHQIVRVFICIWE